MISVRDLAWAAGFLEGEGFFAYHTCPRVGACQVQKEPLERLYNMFGGRVRFEKKEKGYIWRWVLGAKKSVQVMMTLYALMSPKRKEQIANALARWKDARTMKDFGSTICRNGHEITETSAYRYYVKNTIQIECKICAADRQRTRNAAKRLAKV